MSSPCAMAWFGQSGSQAPQLMHSSVMIVATRVSVTAGFGTRARSVPGDRSTDPDRLRIRELANSLFGQLAAIAGGLDAPEGKPRVALHHAVDEYLPGVELVHQAIDLLRILGEGGGAQAELGVVGERDGVVEPLRAHDGGDRAEDLFLPDLGPLGFEGDGRLEEVAGAVQAPAAAGHVRTLLAGAAHLLFQVLEDLPGGERAHLCRVVLRVADLERPHSLDEALLELGGDLLVHDEALGGDAALARVLDAGGDGDLDGLVEVGTGKDDEGIAPSEFEDCLLQLRAGGGRKAATRPVAAGEGGGDDAGVLEDLLHFLAADEERLEAALGIAGVAEDLLDGQRALGNVARVLEQADVAGHQGGGGETEDLPEREVPGHDGEHRAEWLEPLLGAARVGLDGLRSEVALGVLRVVAAAVGALLDLGEGGLAQLSHLQRHQPAERVLALLEQRRGAGEPLAALGEAGPSPASGRGGSFLQLLLDDCIGVGWERLDGFPGRGIHAGDGHGVPRVASLRAMRTTSGTECATPVGAAERRTGSGWAP